MSKNPPRDLPVPHQDALAETELEKDFFNNKETFGKILAETELEEDFFNVADRQFSKESLHEHFTEKVDVIEKRLEADGARFEKIVDNVAEKREAPEVEELVERLKTTNRSKREMVTAAAKNFFGLIENMPLPDALETAPLPKLDEAKIDAKAARNLAREEAQQEKLANSVEKKLLAYEAAHPYKKSELLEKEQPLLTSASDKRVIEANRKWDEEEVDHQLKELADTLKGMPFHSTDSKETDELRAGLEAQQRKLQEKKKALVLQARTLEKEPEPKQEPVPVLSLAETLEGKMNALYERAQATTDTDECKDLMLEARMIKNELTEIKKAEEEAQRVKEALESAKTAVTDAENAIGKEALDAFTADVEAAQKNLEEKTALAETKEQALQAQEAEVAKLTEQLEQAKSVSAPKRGESPGFDGDSDYQQILNDAALEFLKTNDKTWFDRNYNGKQDKNGYLLNTKGEPTPFRPINNVTGGLKEVTEKAKAAFAKTHKDKARLYTTREAGAPQVIEKKMREAHKTMLQARDDLNTARVNIDSATTELQAKKDSFSTLEGGANLTSAREALKKATEAFDAWQQRQETPAVPEEAQPVEPPVVKEKIDSPVEAPVVDEEADEKMRAKKEAREKTTREREINTFKMDYAFHLGQIAEAKKMVASKDPHEAHIGQRALEDLNIREKELQGRYDGLNKDIALNTIEPRPLSSAERARWETTYGDQAVEEVVGVPSEEEQRLRKESTKRLEGRLERLHAKLDATEEPSEEDLETAQMIEDLLLARSDRSPDTSVDEPQQTPEEIKQKEKDALRSELEGQSTEELIALEKTLEDKLKTDATPAEKDLLQLELINKILLERLNAGELEDEEQRNLAEEKEKQAKKVEDEKRIEEKLQAEITARGLQPEDRTKQSPSTPEEQGKKVEIKATNKSALDAANALFR